MYILLVKYPQLTQSYLSNHRQFHWAVFENMSLGNSCSFFILYRSRQTTKLVSPLQDDNQWESPTFTKLFPNVAKVFQGCYPKIVEGSRCYCTKRFPKLLRQRLTFSKYCRSYSAKGSLSLSKLLRQWSSKSVQRFLCQILSNSNSLST